MRSPPLSAFVLALAALLACGGESAPVPAAPVAETKALEGGGTRRDLRFPCGDGECAAWVFLPAGVPRPPVVVMAHGFAGTRDVALPRFAEHFAREGLAALVFDYRHFGASSGAPRQLVDPAEQLEDWRAAVAFARGLEAVDGMRVALWGSSLGGGHALVTAAGDDRLRAVVVQMPLIDTSLEGDATFPGVCWAVRLVVTGWTDLLRSSIGTGSVEIAAIAPAGGFGMIVDDAAYAAFQKLIEPGSTYRNAVAARSPFAFDDYDPARHSAAIAVPVLVVASREDRFAPFAAVETFARTAPDVSVEVIEGDHFDVYSSPALDRAAELEAAFLARHLR